MMREIKAPQEPDEMEGRLSIFAGGSIEMGAAEEWQKKLAAHLAKSPFAEMIDLYNPRRDDWDASWPNDYTFAPFREQVDWELRHQSDADLIVYYFAGGTLSPITLFELGLFHECQPVVGYDPAYKRAGNLQVTNDHFPMDLHEGWDAFLKALDERLQQIAPII